MKNASSEKPLFFNTQIGDNDLIGNKFNGHDLHIYLREQNIYSDHLVLNKQSNDPHTYPYPYPFSNKFDILRNRSFLKSDILHLHLIHNNVIDISLLPIITKLKPTVWTVHDPWALSGHCIHHFDCEKWKTGCGDCPYPDKPFAINFDDTALQFELKKQAVQNSQIAAIVASGWMEDKIKQSPIWSGKKIYKIPFGINQNIFKPADIKEAKKKMEIDPVDRVLFFRSDESPYKGLNILKQTLSSLPRNEKISILTVGEKGLLYEFAEKYKIKEFGWISDDKKLAELYQACDLFLMPSEQETFGMMAVEAMSCGKTVVALDGNTALPNTINAPECGTAVSVKDFPTEIQRLLNNREEMIGRGEKSLQYAKQNYNKDIYVKRIIDTYKDVMSDHKSDDAAKHILQQSARKSENISRKKFPLWYRYLARPLLRLVLKKYKVKFEYDSRFTKK